MIMERAASGVRILPHLRLCRLQLTSIITDRGDDMYAAQPKKLLILNILDILKHRTDIEHRMTQKEIMQILKSEYGMSADRKAVKRNLMELIAYGFQVEFTEIARKGKAGEGESICTDWYLEHDFSDAELRLLIDGLLFSRQIPHSQCRSLIGKLEGLSNDYFKSHVRHIRNLPDNQPANSELFFTIEILDEAISKRRQVSFIYNTYDVDKKLHPRKGESGQPREYLVNPYQMVATNGKYYLIGNYDKYDNVINFRLDRITGIRLLNTPAKPMREVKGLESGLDLPRHMAEHIYMFSGGSIWVAFRAKRYLVNDIIDWFGKDANFSDVTEEEMTVKVKVNEEAIKLWVLQYALHVRILSPQSMADEIRKNLETALSQYAE